MDVNGFNCCGKNWPSSWCGHNCGRAISHEGHCRCGWCGNTPNDSRVLNFEDDYIVTDGSHAIHRRHLTDFEKSRLYITISQKTEILETLEEVTLQNIVCNLGILYDVDVELFKEMIRSLEVMDKDIMEILKIRTSIDYQNTTLIKNK